MHPRRPSPYGPFPGHASISLSSNPGNQFPDYAGSLSHQVRQGCCRTQGGRSGGCCRRLSLSRLVAGSFASRLIPEPFGRRSTPTIVPFPGWVDLDRSTACSGFLSLLMVSATAGGKYKDVVACFRPGTASRRVALQPEGGIRPSIEQDQSSHTHSIMPSRRLAPKPPLSSTPASRGRKEGGVVSHTRPANAQGHRN
jgi:hypothetical protein